MRFAPGKLPEPSAEDVRAARPEAREPTEEERAKGAELAGVIEDESLRKIVAKAAARSLARPS
jgi:hypothetical protein